MSEFGREIVEAIEIDLDYCSRTYGSSPCTAALSADTPHKCCNTFATCQDPDNFDLTSKTIRYVRNRDGLPKGDEFYPALESVTPRAAEINVTGDQETTGPLGASAEITATVRDFTDPDYWFDKYQGERVSGAAQFSGVGYKPEENGTHFSKFPARHKYVVGRPMRYLKGLLGQAWADMRTEHYVLTEAPAIGSDGTARFIGRDVLDLLDDDKFQYPSASTGNLASDIDSTTGTFTVLGDMAEYPVSGRIVIGSEIIFYSRSGSTFFALARGADGSAASSHSQGDGVQWAPRFENARPIDIANTILLAAGVDPSFIPFAEWEESADRWQGGQRLTRTLTKPIGGKRLLGELSVFGMTWFWEAENQRIGFWPLQVLSPGEVAPIFREAVTGATDGHIIQDSVSMTFSESLRLSDVVMHHGTIDPFGDEESESNYRQHTSFSDPSQRTAQKEGQGRVRRIFTPWLGEQGNFSIARDVTGRTMARWSEAPISIEFAVDSKDQASVNFTDIIDVETLRRTDDLGFPLIDRVQVIAREEVEAGHRIRIAVVAYALRGRFGFQGEVGDPDYDVATDQEKLENCYMSNGSNFADGGEQYVMF